MSRPDRGGETLKKAMGIRFTKGGSVRLKKNKGKETLCRYYTKQSRGYVGEGDHLTSTIALSSSNTLLTHRSTC